MDTPNFLLNPIQEEPWPIASHVYVIGEIGINHNGDIGIAKQLIDMAKKTGCDAVKFQKRTIDKVYSKEVLDAPRESPWGTTQREQKEGLEFSLEDYAVIDAYCKEVGIDWFSSSWDVDAQIDMRRFDCPYNKIASAMLTFTPLLEAVAEEKKLTFISTGMSDYDDMDTALEIFKKADCPFVLMHTVSTYPSREKDLNLRMILSLRARYGCPVGYSGHETSVSPALTAVALGAVAIERHITLDRAMYGSDQSASLMEDNMARLVSTIRKIPVILGDGVKNITPEEQNVAGKLRYWRPPMKATPTL